MTGSNIDPRKPCNRDWRPQVWKTIRSPSESAIPILVSIHSCYPKFYAGNEPCSYGMYLPEIFVPWELLNKEVEENGRNYPQRESKEQHSILAFMSKNLDWSNCTPKHSCCEKCIGSWAGESHRCIGGADIFDVDLQLSLTWKIGGDLTEVKWLRCLTCIWITAVQTKVDMRVATIWAQKVWRGGIYFELAFQ